MAHLRNPTGGGTLEKYIYLDSPDTATRIMELNNKLQAAIASANRPPDVREVIKEVYVQDPDLLQRLNDALRELGALKADVAKGSNLRLVNVNATRIEKKEIAEPTEKKADLFQIIERQVFDKQAALYTTIISFLCGALLCFLLLKR